MASTTTTTPPPPLLRKLIQHATAYQNFQDEVSRLALIKTANALVTELENPMEQLSRIGWGQPSRDAALRTAFEMGLLGKLEVQQSLSSTQLAEGLPADPVLISRILKNLAAYGLVKETGKDQYQATPFTVAATTDETFVAGMIYSFEVMTPALDKIPEFLAKSDYQSPSDVCNGPWQHLTKTNTPFFAQLPGNPRIAKAFNDFMIAYAKAHSWWYDIYPCMDRLKGTTKESDILVVDVGGGLGHELSAFHEQQQQQQQQQQQHSNLRGRLILQDTATTMAAIKEKNTLPKVIEPIEHDFFSPQPPEFRGAKAYFLRHIMHDWPDDKCTIILSHLRDAMKPGFSKILISEVVLDDVGTPWQQTSLDWTMMALTASRERTESEWKDLLASAGLKMNGIWRKGDENVKVFEAILATD